MACNALNLAKNKYFALSIELLVLIAVMEDILCIFFGDKASDAHPCNVSANILIVVSLLVLLVYLLRYFPNLGVTFLEVRRLKKVVI